MKIKIAVSTLNDVLGVLEPIAARGAALTQNRNVLLEAAGDGTLRLTANGNAMQGMRTIGSVVETTGTSCVDIRQLTGIVSKLPRDKEVLLEAVDKVLAVSCQRSRFRLPLLPVESFQSWERPGAQSATIEIQTARLRELVQPVMHAMSADDSRPALAGFALMNSAASPGLHAVATDGMRLALRSASDVTLALPEGGIVVPRECARDILRFVEKTPVVRLTADATKLEIAYEGNRLLSKLVGERFPDFERIVPTGENIALRLPSVELTAAIDRVLTVSGKQSRVVMRVREDTLELAAALDGQAAAESIDLEATLSDKEMKSPLMAAEFAINGRFLADAVAQMSASVIELQLRGERNAVLVLPAPGGSGTPGNRSFEIIMLMIS